LTLYNWRTLLNTVRYLKFKQIAYRLLYFAKKRRRFSVSLKEVPAHIVKLSDFPLFSNRLREHTFTFLNLSKSFDTNIDWNFAGYGKLWTYNLNYFDFLNQRDMDIKKGISLMKDFISKISDIRDGLEPYPISLRGVNWIKFLSKNRILDREINAYLYAQYRFLVGNLEYHLMGNHLLENAFSLMFGAYYFRNEKFYKKAKKILVEELNEQVLSDGAHFELSPMYHQVLLGRLLDCINLVKNNPWKDHELLEFLIEKAKKMLGWLKNVTFSSGNIPLLNDSVFGIAFSTSELEDYALRLGIEPAKVELGESGYRLIRKKRYEIIVDVANVKASYIPGHTHADTFTFELYVDGIPIVVDSGVSTYENNSRRRYERSTAAHNTVEVNDESSSEVWSSFRLGDRAHVREVLEKRDYIKAIHDGYFRKLGVFHQREFIFGESNITIKDRLTGEKVKKAVARLHFHPNVKVRIVNDLLIVNEKIKIRFNVPKVQIRDYSYAPEFNKLLPAKVAEVQFHRSLECRIEV